MRYVSKNFVKLGSDSFAGVSSLVNEERNSIIYLLVYISAFGGTDSSAMKNIKKKKTTYASSIAKHRLDLIKTRIIIVERIVFRKLSVA